MPELRTQRLSRVDSALAVSVTTIVVSLWGTLTGRPYAGCSQASVSWAPESAVVTFQSVAVRCPLTPRCTSAAFVYQCLPGLLNLMPFKGFCLANWYCGWNWEQSKCEEDLTRPESALGSVRDVNGKSMDFWISEFIFPFIRFEFPLHFR